MTTLEAAVLVDRMFTDLDKMKSLLVADTHGKARQALGEVWNSLAYQAGQDAIEEYLKRPRPAK